MPHSDSIFKDSMREVPEWTVSAETLVDVYLSADQSIAAGSWETLGLDAKNKDELDEFDTGTHQFTPEETKWCLIACVVEFGVGADLDDLTVILRNTTAGENVLREDESSSGAGNMTLALYTIKKLTGGDNYEIWVRNNDSDDTVQGGENLTTFQVRSAFR